MKPLAWKPERSGLLWTWSLRECDKPDETSSEYSYWGHYWILGYWIYWNRLRLPHNDCCKSCYNVEGEETPTHLCHRPAFGHLIRCLFGQGPLADNLCLSDEDLRMIYIFVVVTDWMYTTTEFHRTGSYINLNPSELCFDQLPKQTNWTYFLSTWQFLSSINMTE